MSEPPSHVSVKLNLMADRDWLGGEICKQTIAVEPDVGADVDVGCVSDFGQVGSGKQRSLLQL
ncbi:uncharacterized protein TrAtP1_004852 [Trichoderma atroviride]|uniref:uncharacterized protein n=1 Tax=Hypocrea atroviridis TaxID=63577 RepID=UPI00332A5BD7|nr:hypothetical protein TrAtP1_004852 [Trichoderma atroviride]